MDFLYVSSAIHVKLIRAIEKSVHPQREQLPSPGHPSRGRRNDNWIAGSSGCLPPHRLTSVGSNMHVCYMTKIFILDPHDSLQLVVFFSLPPSQNVLLLHATRTTVATMVLKYNHHCNQKPQQHLHNSTLHFGIAQQQTCVYLLLSRAATPTMYVGIPPSCNTFCTLKQVVRGCGHCIMIPLERTVCMRDGLPL